MLGRPGGLHSDQLDAERDREPARDLVLQGEQIARIAVEPLCPKMRVGRGIDQLSINAELVARPANAPFQHIAHTRLAADLLRVDRLVPVRERGIARDHEHARHPRQIGRQILGDPVREILLLGVTAEIGKRQHDDRQTRRRDGRRT
jgi:hypothetical protein